MNRLPIYIICLFLLSACQTNQADFKSETLPIKDRGQLKKVFTDESLPKKINLNLEFYPQAPEGNWDAPWKESCEEASIVMTYFGATEKPLDKTLFKKTIVDMVEWQKENFGHYEDTTVKQTNEIIKHFFNFPNTKILENPKVKDLKAELAKGNFIVAPLAGRELNNPFYSGRGPYYHMLVIRGYDEKHFITNDPGTKKGENYSYMQETIMNALHDFNKEDIQLGERRVIIMKTSK